MGESEDELCREEGVEKASMSEPHNGGHEGVTCLEKEDPCLLADPYVVSGWVEKRLGTVSAVQREQALRITRLGTRTGNCFALWSRSLLKVVITGVALSAEEGELKLKIPGVCDPHFGRRRPGGECGETEKILSVLLSFDDSFCPEPITVF